MAVEVERRATNRRFAGMFTENLALKGAALFFACVLWLVVSAEEPTEQVVQVVVSPRLDSTLALVGRRPTVRALVVGRARELIKLAGEPPVVRPLIEGVPRGDSVEVTLMPEDVELPADAQVLVREVRPRTVMLYVGRVTRPTPPTTPAESALAGLVPAVGARRADSAAVADTLADALLQPDSLRMPDTTVPRDSSRRSRAAMRRDSLWADTTPRRVTSPGPSRVRAPRD